MAPVSTMTGVAAATQKSALPTLSESEFRFVVAEGEGSTGYNALKISPSGECEYTWLEWRKEGSVTIVWRQYWHRATFQVTDSTVEETLQLLRRITFLSLNDEYLVDIEDGSQFFAKFVSGEKCKGVFCNSVDSLPREIEVLRDFVKRRYLDPYKPEIQKSPLIRPGERREETPFCDEHQNGDETGG